MDQDKAVNRMLHDLKMQGIVPEEEVGRARIFLRALWVAGYEEGYHERSFTLGRRVGQYTKSGHLINTFRSITEAHKKTNFPERTLYDALRKGHVTKQGWIWKYIIEDENKTKRPSRQRDRGFTQFRMVSESIQEEKETIPQREDAGILRRSEINI